MTRNTYEERSVSVGGYGSLVPYHGTAHLDPAKPGKARNLPLRNDLLEVDEVIEDLHEAIDTIDVGESKNELYYRMSFSDFGFSSSGIENLIEDIQTSFDLRKPLKETLEEQYSKELDTHRPCFTVISPAEQGLFYMLLRGGKDQEGNYSYFTRTGVLLDEAVMGWPNYEKMLPDDGRAITAEEIELRTVRADLGNVSLNRVRPVDQEISGDADIIEAKNPLSKSSLSGPEEVVNAVAQPSHLTFRVKGGTLGFDKEKDFKFAGVYAISPETPSLWGHPVVIGSPMCSAVKEEGR